MKTSKELFDYENEFSMELKQNEKEEISYEIFLFKYKHKLDSYIKTTEIILKLDSKNLADALSKGLKIPFNLQEEFSEIFFYKYSHVLYEFINILLALVEKNLVFELNEFFLIIEEDLILYFYNIPLLYPENVMLVKNYFQFVFNYRSIVKNSRVNLHFKLTDTVLFNFFQIYFLNKSCDLKLYLNFRI
jgi:hypothetical protein